jgi:hypothetical protein
MRRFISPGCNGLLVVVGALALSACADDGATANGPSSGGSSSAGSNGSAGSPSAGSSSTSGGNSGSGGSANTTAGSGGSANTSGGSSAGGSTAGSGGSGGASGGAGGSSADVCAGALFCEKFDDYAGVTSIADKQKFGPWHATLSTAGASMGLDGTHKISGSSALHVHIDNTVTAGGRLFADGAQPVFASKPTHIYGRMMMYIDPNGTSVHWTFFGVSGSAEPSSPATGRNAQYIMSSLPKAGVNTYSFVYGLQALGADGYHDCSSQAATAMPSAWACVSFEMDSVARKLRMYKDGAADPILSIDDHGKGCVAPTVVTSPWYGPAITQLFVGAWSFHAMNAPLDVWIDDLVVDTKPVACPTQ